MTWDLFLTVALYAAAVAAFCVYAINRLGGFGYFVAAVLLLALALIMRS